MHFSVSACGKWENVDHFMELNKGAAACREVITLIKVTVFHPMKRQTINELHNVNKFPIRLTTHLSWMLFSSHHHWSMTLYTRWDWATHTLWWASLNGATSDPSKADLLLRHWPLCCRLADDESLIDEDTRLGCAAASMIHESTGDDDCCSISVVYRKSNHWQVLLADSYWLMCCSNDLASSDSAVALFVRPSSSGHDLLKTPKRLE